MRVGTSFILLSSFIPFASLSWIDRQTIEQLLWQMLIIKIILDRKSSYLSIYCHWIFLLLLLLFFLSFFCYSSIPSTSAFLSFVFFKTYFNTYYCYKHLQLHLLSLACYGIEDAKKNISLLSTILLTFSTLIQSRYIIIIIGVIRWLRSNIYANF